MNAQRDPTLKDQTILDNKNREQALSNDSFIVEAPAGAGKTELLTQRFLKLLQTVQAPEEIIAITFTNKAASEMRLRIIDSLIMASDRVAPTLAHKKITYNLGLKALARSAELNWSLLETPSRLRIYTIDSLSSNLARQMPLLSRFGTQPAVRDDASAYYLEAATRALDHLDTDGIGDIIQTALRYFDNDTFKLTNLLAEMLAKRDQWLPYSQSENTAKIAENALKHLVSLELATTATRLNSTMQTSLMPIVRYATTNLDEQAPLKLLENWQTPLPKEAGHLEQWQVLVGFLLTSAGTFRKQITKKIGLPATIEAKPFKEALSNIIEDLNQHSGLEESFAKIRLLPNTNQNKGTWKIIATLSQLLHIAVGELWLVFQSHNEVDFVEISQRSLLALEDTEGNTTDLALKLDYRIQHLLVDEFQDTSPTQVKLIRALTQGWQPDDERTIFLVGDPMQSIYRFRKANVGLFLRAAKKGIGTLSLTPLKLWHNNRSSPNIVNWVNQAFEIIFPNQDNSAHGAIKYRPFIATKAENESAGVFVHALLDISPHSNTAEENDEPLLSNNIRNQEADRIIKIIQDTWQQDPNRKIAVLVRARKHLHTLVTEIRRNHPTLNFQAVEIEELANRQVVQDLLSLTHALHHRADRLHWVAVLRAPWCGLTLADCHALLINDKHSTVIELMQNEQRLQTLSTDGHQRIVHVRDIMQDALDQQGRINTSRWVQGVWLMLNGAECLWDANDVQDVQAFFDRIQQLDNAGRFSLENLTKEVQKLYAAPNATAPDTLQFMTIHKSKGLEFDTVILPGLDRKTGNSEQSLLLWEEVSIDKNNEDIDLIVAPITPKGDQTQKNITPYDYLKTLEKQRAEYENARVLYVAATRAERCLHLLGAAKINPDTGICKAPKNTFLEMLWPVVHQKFTTANAISDTSNLNINNTDIDAFAPKLIRLEKLKLPAVFNHSTHVKNNQQATSKENQNTVTLSADIGILAHLYMQIAADNDLTLWNTQYIESLKPAMHRWLKQKNYPVVICAQATDRVAELIHITFNSEQGAWVLKARPTAANELVIEAGNNDEINKQIIDRTFIEDGIRWIIDYKSVPLDKNISRRMLKDAAEQFRPQLERYEQLFDNEAYSVQKAIFFMSIGELILF